MLLDVGECSAIAVTALSSGRIFAPFPLRIQTGDEMRQR